MPEASRATGTGPVSKVSLVQAQARRSPITIGGSPVSFKPQPPRQELPLPQACARADCANQSHNRLQHTRQARWTATWLRSRLAQRMSRVKSQQQAQKQHRQQEQNGCYSCDKDRHRWISAGAREACPPHWALRQLAIYDIRHQAPMSSIGRGGALSTNRITSGVCESASKAVAADSIINAVAYPSESHSTDQAR